MGINRELFQNYFNFHMSTAMIKAVYNVIDQKKNNKLASVIKSGLSDVWRWNINWKTGWNNCWKGSWL